MRRIGLIIGVMLIISTFGGTALAGSVGIRISQGAGIHRASYRHQHFAGHHYPGHGKHQSVNHHNRRHRNRHPVKPHHPNHKHHRFAKNRHPSHGSHVFYGYYYPSGSYRGRDYSYKNGEGKQGIYPVVFSDQEVDSPDSKKEAKEPLPPHIETLGQGDKATISSYETIPSGNTETHIAVYGLDKQ